MAKEELIIGLKNAIERGESIQGAMQTLIAAGYDAKEVQDAASQVNLGVIGQIPESAQQPKEGEQAAEKPQALPQVTAPIQEKPKMKMMTKLLIIILILLGAGILAFMLFGEQILKMFFGG